MGDYSCIDKNNSLLLKPSRKLITLLIQFNNNTLENSNKDLEDSLHSKYSDIDDTQINLGSLSKSYEDLTNIFYEALIKAMVL